MTDIAGQETVSKPANKAEVRRQYLMEKYVWKWKQFVRSRSESLFPRLLKLGHNNWLRQVKTLLLNHMPSHKGTEISQSKQMS